MMSPHRETEIMWTVGMECDHDISLSISLKVVLTC